MCFQLIFTLVSLLRTYLFLKCCFLKLNHCGLRGILSDWFKSYLENRKQYVSINWTNSDTLPINYGVPQWSTLGPLYSYIY